MKCPHCRVEFRPEVSWLLIGQDVESYWGLERYKCPNEECNKWILYLVNGTPVKTSGPPFAGFQDVGDRRLIRPKGAVRAPVPPEVPENLAEDYAESCLVLPDSPKASAALSRRCLQNLLREHAEIKPGNLADEIQEVIDSGQLPSHLVEAVDAVRNIGNFAAHPIKSKVTGQILPVEPGEAEWNLDVLELLFDFYFVQPKVTRRKRDALDAKLKEAGKPPMK
jgi:hypothetical protein